MEFLVLAIWVRDALDTIVSINGLSAIAATASAIAAIMSYKISRESHRDRNTPSVSVIMDSGRQTARFSMGTFGISIENKRPESVTVFIKVRIVLTDRDNDITGKGAYSLKTPLPIQPLGILNGFFVWSEHVDIDLVDLVKRHLTDMQRGHPFRFYFVIDATARSNNKGRKFESVNPTTYYLYHANSYVIEPIYMENPDAEIKAQREEYKMQKAAYQAKHPDPV